MVFNRRILGNVASLGIMQAVNYILPIVLTPFLVSRIGISNVGIIATMMAIAAYMQFLIDYGFNLTATREIAKNGYNDKNASKVTSAVFNVKILALLLITAISLFLIILIPFINENKLIFIFTICLTVTQSFFPVWHFQGAEKMQYISICNSPPKIFSAILIFYYISTPSDTWKVQLIFSLGATISFLWSVIILIIKFNYRYSFSCENSLNQIKLGYSIFVARISSGLYKNYNILILGYLSSSAAVGVYSIAERILRSLQMVQNVVGDTLYPVFSKGANGSTVFFKEKIKKYRMPVVFIYMITSIGIFLFSGLIASVMAKNAQTEVRLCLEIMSAAFFFGGLNYIYAILGLTSCGYSNYFSKCVILTGIFNIILSTVLCMNFSYAGASISLVASEFFLLVLVIIYSKKVGII